MALLLPFLACVFGGKSCIVLLLTRGLSYTEVMTEASH